MFDIITFGSATWDIFLRTKNFEVLKDKKFITGKGICFNLGSKVDIGEIYSSSGGGGTNTAATFAKQGLKVAYCGKVGEDLAGQKIIKDLEYLGVDCQFVSGTKLKTTNLSIVLSLGEKDRTILVYRGASELLGKRDIPWSRLKTKWFYLAPLSGKLTGLTEKIVDFAKKNKIKIALNPGNSQLCLGNIKNIIKKVDILILNQEEASLLTKIPYQKEKDIFKKIVELCPRIIIITKGSKGGMVSGGKYLYRFKAPQIKVVDRTGGGDAAASGFISGFIKSKGNIEYAIQLGMTNAVSCLQKWGAKNGLLEKEDKFKKIKIIKNKI